MTSATVVDTGRHSDTRPLAAAADSLRLIVPLGRALYAAIFLLAAPGHFTGESIGYAAHEGVPLANLLVPTSGVLSLIGAISILLGYKTRIGAWLLVLFLIPVTVTMHDFWNVQDPMMARIQQVMFLKNLSMLGGALLLAHFGSGPLSLDAQLAARAATGSRR